MCSIENILVSVIVAVFNTGAYLDRCVQSICSQTHRQIEILLIDDGSWDDSPALCDGWAKKDPRISVIHQANSGLGKARDRGIEAAKSEWLCFVDSDDYIHEAFVETLLQAAISNNCLIAQCRLCKVYDDTPAPAQPPPETQLLDYRHFFSYTFQQKALAAGHSPFSACVGIYHRSLFQSLRFGEFRFAEDSAFKPNIVYAARERPIALSNQALYWYYQRPDSLLHGKRDLTVLDRYRAKQSVLDLWRQAQEPDLYDLFFPDYFHCLIEDYTNLRRDHPNRRGEYEFLHDKILEALPEAHVLCCPDLILPPGAWRFSDTLLHHAGPLLLYGEPDFMHTDILPWLKFSGLEAAAMWDAGAYPDAEGLPPFTGSRPALVLNTLFDSYASMRAKARLYRLGYQAVMNWAKADAALKYIKYERFLPFLIGGSHGVPPSVLADTRT